MYICLCHAVTDRQIRQAVQDGAGGLRQVQLSLRVGTQCGKCIPAAREIVQDAQRASAMATPAPDAERPRLTLVSSR